METLPQEVFGAWQHSFEEDNGRVTVFRPAGYSLAAAGAREQLEIKPDGTFIRTIPGRSGGLEPVAGEWQQQGGECRIQYTYQPAGQAPGSAPHSVDIVECSADILRLHKL
ncbi:hypothetical protein [Paenibacillus tengchongensis]|uniref:hypothetical protein n=1 Tax=Paenibacillus tengchongensis TaxID=2608684 RepID=UPI00124D3473|nr:hypothetical protein [Paenibacillus tengchongensis]